MGPRYLGLLTCSWPSFDRSCVDRLISDILQVTSDVLQMTLRKRSSRQGHLVRVTWSYWPSDDVIWPSDWLTLKWPSTKTADHTPNSFNDELRTRVCRIVTCIDPNWPLDDPQMTLNSQNTVKLPMLTAHQAEGTARVSLRWWGSYVWPSNGHQMITEWPLMACEWPSSDHCWPKIRSE